MIGLTCPVIGLICPVIGLIFDSEFSDISDFSDVSDVSDVGDVNVVSDVSDLSCDWSVFCPVIKIQLGDAGIEFPIFLYICDVPCEHLSHLSVLSQLSLSFLYFPPAISPNALLLGCFSPQ